MSLSRPRRPVSESIGASPLVELTRLVHLGRSRSWRRTTPGGGIKDRSALGMLLGRIQDGRLVCGYYGIRFVCVVDPRTNRQNIAIMRAFGAEVEVVTDTDPVTGEYLPVPVARVRGWSRGCRMRAVRISTPTR